MSLISKSSWSASHLMTFSHGFLSGVWAWNLVGVNLHGQSSGSSCMSWNNNLVKTLQKKSMVLGGGGGGLAWFSYYCFDLKIYWDTCLHNVLKETIVATIIRLVCCQRCRPNSRKGLFCLNTFYSATLLGNKRNTCSLSFTSSLC